MWTCPKCGREFKKQNQDHYCGKAPKTIDEYIAGQPEKCRPYLQRSKRSAPRCPAGSGGENFMEHADFLEKA